MIKSDQLRRGAIMIKASHCQIVKNIDIGFENYIKIKRKVVTSKPAFKSVADLLLFHHHLQWRTH